MPLCKFFINGNCRFGSKCTNEHVDIKQLVKSDVEVATQGRQWPLSCFGPFRDKPVLPNFIDDQSMEEIRLMCYEAKQKNYFDRFTQEFHQNIGEAINKMKALLTFSPQILEMLITLYDSTPTEICTPNAGVTPMAGANSFGSSTGMFGGSGMNSQNTNANAAGNIFGGVNAAFGNGSNALQQQNSIFGQTSTMTKPTNSIFGGGGGVGQQTSIFGAQTNVGPGNIFGGGQQQQNTNVNNVFSITPQQQQQQQSNSGFGLFSQQQPSATTTSAFGQQQQQQPGGIFGQQLNNVTTGGGIFSSQANNGSNIFNQSSVNAQPTVGGNIFGGNTGAGVQNQNIFATNSTQPQAVNQTTNLFGQAVQQPMLNNTNNSGGIFQQSQAVQQSQYFMQQQQQPPPQQQQQQQPINSKTVYSKIENLTPEEIEAFNADTFQVEIPFSPPPFELIH